MKRPPILTDHAILQRARPLPVWGWADPGEEATVTPGAAKATGTPVGCACGDGVIDWERVMRICQKARRDIVLSVECGTVA